MIEVQKRKACHKEASNHLSDIVNVMTQNIVQKPGLNYLVMFRKYHMGYNMEIKLIL